RSCALSRTDAQPPPTQRCDPGQGTVRTRAGHFTSSRGRTAAQTDGRRRTRLRGRRMTLLGLGTYRSHDVVTSTNIAVSAGCPLIDTAPVYGKGTHQVALASVLRAHPNVRVATKVGYLTRGQAEVALTAGALSSGEAVFGHSIAPEYVSHQVAMSRAELRRPSLDIVYLHNPEHRHEERGDLHNRIRAAFTVLEAEKAQGTIRGYGVATWT